MSRAGFQTTLMLVVDLALIMAATLAAVGVRDDLVVSPERLAALQPYLIFTALAAVVILPASRVSHGIWRFSSRSDYGRILVSVSLIVLAACAVTFSVDRLAHVPRSLPLLQATFAVGLLVASRAFFRAWRARRQSLRLAPRPFLVPKSVPRVNVLVVGVSQLAETYLRAVKECAPQSVHVAGVLSQRDRQVGRHLAGHPILGRPEAVDDILAELDTHGIVVERVVIACRLDQLSAPAREALFALEAQRNMDVKVLVDALGLSPLYGADTSEARARFAIEPERLSLNSQRSYWSVKRAIDVVGALVLLVALAPLVAVAAVALAVSLGFPVLFWQQRPGLGGRPFRLYKLRTMRPAHDPTGRHLSDEERTSWVGDIVRRTRLDEVPQLLSILAGDMSFIGPRPLLPRDQSPADRARLLVRPGLTGWAQVTGGRTISADDKAALDVWYVQHASLMLDLQIVLRTVPIVLLGERVFRADIVRAWQDLRASGIVSDAPPRGRLKRLHEGQ